MFVVESRHTRRLIARLDRGEEVIGSLKKLAASERFRAAWIRGTGHLEWVEIVHWDAAREAETRPRRLEGPLLAISVEGNVSMRLGEPYVELRGVFSRERDHGLEVVGGQVSTASALALELVLEVYEDARLERDEDPPTGLALWKGERTPGVVARSAAREPTSARDAMPARPVEAAHEVSPPTSSMPRPLAPRPSAEPAPTATLGWAQVAAVSREVDEKRTSAVPRTSDASDGEPVLGKGDWIEHRQFGLCRIDGEDADGALIIRLPSGMRKHIKLDFLEVLPPRHDGERRIHPLRPRKR